MPTSTASHRVLTPGQARRIALAAQGFADPRPAPFAATTRHLQRVIDRVGVIQIDSVNVVSRSHYLPFFSRLGPYDSSLLDRARDTAPRRLVEYWAHEASLIPPSTWPLLDFRMQRAERESWEGMAHVARQHPELVEAVYDTVMRAGPMTSREVELAVAHTPLGERTDWGWNWSVVKNALEHLFWTGRLTSGGRTSQFERRYADPAGVVPRGLPQRDAWLDRSQRLPPEEAYVELVRIAAQATGVGTQVCLRDYFRLKGPQVQPAIDRLVADGELEPVTVQGWRRPAYLHVDARRPRRLHARALLSPFDSLVWQRERTEALFDFYYRLEIYVPAAKRIHGYYVLPFLLGDRLAGRCDLKADRARSALLVRSVSWEPSAPPEAASELGAELRSMADWLELDRVEHASTPAS